MELMKYTVKLNMKDTGIISSGIRMKQGDRGMLLLFKIYSGNSEIYNASEIPNVVFRRPDGSSVVGTASANGQQYQYKLEGNELEIAGKLICDVKFEMGTMRESTASFSLECVPDTVSNTSQGADIYVNDLATLKKDIQKVADGIVDSAKTAQYNADLSRSYAVGTNGEVRKDDGQDNAKYYKELSESNSNSALRSANLASQKAETASLSESNAGQYALNAASSEANAKASEENAKKSEESARKSSSDAAQSADDAENSAQDASKSAANASTYEASAKDYAESAAESAGRAEAVANISPATQEKAGIVKPDGTTITVDEDGIIHGVTATEVLDRLDGLSAQYDKLNDWAYERVDGIWDEFGIVDNSIVRLDYEKISYDDIVDNLISTSESHPLSANMGKYLNEKIEAVSNGILNRVYPVGSVYISLNNNSPANFIGGTWERLISTFLYAAISDIGQSGGESYHQITEAELPPHRHDIPVLSGTTDTSGSHSHKYGSSSDLAAPGGNHGTAFQANGYDTSTAGAHSHTFSTSASETGFTGEADSMCLMPPYINVYMWRRIA